MDKCFQVILKNMPEKVERFIVARLDNGSLWYWGSWDNLDDAKSVAEEFDNALIVFN